MKKLLASLLFFAFSLMCSSAFAQMPIKAGLFIGPQFLASSESVDEGGGITAFGFTAFGDYYFQENMSVGLEIGYASSSKTFDEDFKVSMSIVPIMGTYK
ncbi:outer membrane beta-barrel protein [Flammeovirga aprica]|uniref:Porin family protein n=1 Tax=Flammeovirga aprica JL-4 TaxID=694437 RepID=A0A7X9RTQ1_9BACT|nr:outer membrane beta-barrel protein [Flammeovirga aprica]NME68761.1 porin family protein [Flammeovirga aprica JL-4]